VALKLKDIISEKAKNNQKGGQGGVLLPQKSAEAIDRTISGSPVPKSGQEGYLRDILFKSKGTVTTYFISRVTAPASYF